MEDAFTAHKSFSQAQRQLVGAYFLHEYSFEAAALFNPSIVPHHDQSGVAAGCRRFILSLRAVGEGHISSPTLRAGILARSEEHTSELQSLMRISYAVLCSKKKIINHISVVHVINQ